MTYITTRIEVDKRDLGTLKVYGENGGKTLTRKAKKKEIPYVELSLDNFYFAARNLTREKTDEFMLYHFEIGPTHYVFHGRALRKHRPDLVDAIPPLEEDAIDVARDRETGKFRQEYFGSW